jgi:hypothetical protein
MSRLPKHSGAIAAAHAEIRALVMTCQDYSQKLTIRAKKAVTNQQIEQWDDPANITLLENRLITLANKVDKTENDFVTIGAICAILTNFEETE